MKNMRLLLLFIVTLPMCLFAQENINNNPFKQLKQDLPTPNSYRTASGAPGHEYWQQQADYIVDVEIDDEKQRLYGNETITYHNNSPDDLRYLWVQLDQNVRAKDSDSHLIRSSKVDDKMSLGQLSRLDASFDGGFKIEHVKDASGRAMKHMINKTMMRIDLSTPLKPNQKVSFSIKWWYNINNTKEVSGRSGYEHFKEDDNNVYVIAQWFPRMCVYNDVEGWQNKQFLGRGEFALVFGDYEVNITVPSDHLVSSTGVLQNPNQVLSKDHKSRLDEARKGGLQPVIIATYDEAEDRIKTKKINKKTWKYKAENVRDFAFATSRRFIWDAIGVKMSDGRTVMAQSMWVKEGDCLWSQFSTKAVAHTIKWFSHYTIDYPYPNAWSIDGSMGMEYPMICFNYGRCEEDGTYSQRMKYGHIGVIIHEVGHNWFPMIINSDERQWTWMDEGLNTFTQYLTEQQWERNYPHRRGPADKITGYMGGDKSRISPIMTNSESIHQFGNNAYGKPATALNILRETIMGRELFDHAFKEYSRRWAFKHPSPADFFRTMEDASGVDLDWFWRGWFYTNDHVDLALSDVSYYQVNSKNPKTESAEQKAKRADGPRDIGSIRNEKDIDKTLSEIDPTIIDFYSKYDPLDYNILDEEEYQAYYDNLTAEEKALMEGTNNYYQLTFEKKGGLVMPIIFEFEYADGSTEYVKIPAEAWRMGNSSITKVFGRDKEVVNIVLDPYLETADVDRSNNYFPPKQEQSKFELFKQKRFGRGAGGGENPMQRANRAKEKTIKP